MSIQGRTTEDRVPQPEHTIHSTILFESDLARREGVSTRTTKRWRTTGEGPAYIRIGMRRVGYRLSDVEAWEATRTFAHRADELSRKLQDHQSSAAQSRPLEAAQSV